MQVQVESVRCRGPVKKMVLTLGREGAFVFRGCRDSRMEEGLTLQSSSEEP